MQGALITADPATVERSGSFVRCSEMIGDALQWCRRGACRRQRKSHWRGIMIYRGRTPLKSTNRPPFHDDRPGRRERSVVRDRDDVCRSGRGAATVSQETCHPCRAQSPPWGRCPAASTEVVMAEQLFSRVYRMRLAFVRPAAPCGVAQDCARIGTA